MTGAKRSFSFLCSCSPRAQHLPILFTATSLNHASHVEHLRAVFALFADIADVFPDPVREELYALAFHFFSCTFLLLLPSSTLY